MRSTRLVLLLATLLAPLAARADDTKPPAIGEVKASQKGGKVSIEAKITDETGVLSATCSHRKMGAAKFEDSPMVKNDYDDTFKVSFSGGADTEYFIQSTDLLGNGPSAYGSASKPMSLGGKATAVASNEPPAQPTQPAQPAQPTKPATPKEPKEPIAKNDPPTQPKEPRAAPQPRHGKTAKAESTPPSIQHRKPSVALLEGQEFKLRARIVAADGVKDAVLFARPQGYTDSAYKVKIPLVSTGGEAYEVTVPADVAHGTIEYYLMALDNSGHKAGLGDPDNDHWFSISFKSAGGAAEQSLVISHNALAKVQPGKPIHIRAQATLPNSAELNEQEAADAETKMAGATAKILFRAQDAGDQVMDMVGDMSGGLGGFSADLPAAEDGHPVYYQIVVCLADKCSIDTGSKHKWNGVTATNGDPVPTAPITAVSSKAPAGLPE
jgi:hypothetical protein